MSKGTIAILYGVALVSFSAIMGGLHWLMVGISRDFGYGLVVGLFLGYGILLLASREVRKNSMIDY